MSALAKASATESFLRQFHDANPGGSPLAFSHRQVSDAQGHIYTDSYAALLAAAQTETEARAEPSAAFRMLDLGCGDGHLLGRAATGLHCVGIDLSHGELMRARQRLGPDAALVMARAQQLPFEDECMDVVVSHMALMLMDEPKAVLAEICRILKPQGRLVGVVGAQPPSDADAASRQTDALSGAWQKLLRQAGRQAHEAMFADARSWRSHESLVTLLSPHFRSVEIRRLTGVVRGTPAALWEWFAGTYDLALVPSCRHADIQRGLIDAAAALAAPQTDGTIDMTTHYWLLLAQGVLPASAAQHNPRNPS